MAEHDPYAIFPAVPSFEVTSTDLQDGDTVPALHWAAGGGGEDVSPQLSWSGFPEGTKSFAVTVYDPDAPTASGFWHWAVCNIPADVTELPANAGNAEHELLPPGALTIKNELRQDRYSGPNPPEGTGRHRYFIVVWALDKPLDLDPESTPAVLGFNAGFAALGRASLVVTAEYGDIPAS
ncbi:MAG: YbhB/YbcL family Raf kinase inhibitor-like protein [Naasia sp.]|nr:YbhB/YbcL family Raf kinase inhibitor-like protein [Naasia sp.]